MNNDNTDIFEKNNKNSKTNCLFLKIEGWDFERKKNRRKFWVEEGNTHLKLIGIKINHWVLIM